MNRRRKIHSQLAALEENGDGDEFFATSVSKQQPALVDKADAMICRLTYR